MLWIYLVTIRGGRWAVSYNPISMFLECETLPSGSVVPCVRRSSSKLENEPVRDRAGAAATLLKVVLVHTWTLVGRLRAREP